MDRKAIPIILVIITAAIIGVIISVLETDESTNGIENITEFDDSIGSGPISILKTEYRLGENIFYHIRNVPIDDVGYAVFVTPNNIVFAKVPIAGIAKADSNGYIKPDTFVKINICTPEELVGIWNVHFEGLPYNSFQFEMLDEFIPGGEMDLEIVC